MERSLFSCDVIWDGKRLTTTTSAVDKESCYLLWQIWALKAGVDLQIIDVHQVT